MTISPRTRVIALLSLSVLVALVSIQTAFARIINNTIDSNAVVADNGRHLVVTGPIACDSSERVEIRVTVTQRTTGALAEGLTAVLCTGELQQWTVHAPTHGNEPFEEGAAVAVALARTTERGHATDAHQWLVPITLTAE